MKAVLIRNEVNELRDRGKQMEIISRVNGMIDEKPNKDLANMCASMISRQMSEMGIQQDKLADMLGMTRGNIGHYITGRRIPPLDKFIQLLSIFGLESKPISEILSFGKQKTNLVNFPQPVVSKCPVLSWEDAINWPINKNEIVSRKNLEQLSSELILNSNCYALKVKDDLMMSRAENHFFREGTYIIVDPTKEYRHLSFVVAKQPGSNELVFRQYKKYSGTEFISVFKDDMPNRTVQLTSDIKICGVVVAHLDILIK